MFLKVIACEIAQREICYVAAQSPNLVDVEFLTQGYHDNPCVGRDRIQERIDVVPEGKFDAVLIGYGLCSNILVGLTTRHTPLVIPRAHDCITFFLGSKECYQQFFSSRPGTYYYTSGWLECYRRNTGQWVNGSMGQWVNSRGGASLPVPASISVEVAYEQWVRKYGEERARYLLEVMDRYTNNYTHGVLIDFDFTQRLNLREQVQRICAQRGWEFEEVAGDIGLLQRWMDGEWNDDDFLIVRPGERVVATYDERVVAAE